MKKQFKFDSSKFFRRAIFAGVLIGVFLLHTVFSFGGLTHKTGIDQAQVAREVARGKGLTTQFIRPLSVQQHLEHDKEVNLEHMPETYHSPLNILVYAGVIKIIGADTPGSFAMGDNDSFYLPDQAIAVTCALFFLIAIGVNYLLINRIFDEKIAATVAVLMVVSEHMWKITQSGLPQMLMLALFSIATYLMWRAIEAQEAEKKPLIPALLSGFFFGLLALTHWMTLWIFIGYFIFAVGYFRPRGAVGVTLLLTIIAFIAAPLVFYYQQSGEPLGSALYAIHNGHSASGASIMRELETPGLNVRGILMKTIQSTLLQFGNIHNYLGGFIVAPAFFIALLHPFKRTSISIFRWSIALMWVFAAVGMAVFGLNKEAVDPNQLHILFAPLMVAYAIALMSIVWSRTDLSKESGIIGNLHLAVIILIAATPMLIFVKNLSQSRRSNVNIGGVNALSLNKSLQSITTSRDLIISDQPWAVAWYADRHSIWTPKTIAQLEIIEEIANENNPIAGLHFSSMNYSNKDILRSWSENRDLAPLAYAPWVSYFTRLPANVTFSENAQISALIDTEKGRYKHRNELVGLLYPSTYYSREKAAK